MLQCSEIYWLENLLWELEKVLREQAQDIIIQTQWIRTFTFTPCLSNIEITKSFNCKPTVNGAYLRDTLLRIRDGAYAINLNDKKVNDHIDFHFFFIDRNTPVYFDSFGSEYRTQDELNKRMAR